MNNDIPAEALTARLNLEEILNDTVVAIYLYGSAVAGGLKNNSDVDIMAVVDRRLTEVTRRRLAGRLLAISAKVGNADGLRSLEVTVVNRGDVVPWRYPPRKEFIYGEWLRRDFENGCVPEPSQDPDLAILLSQVRAGSVALAGKEASELLDPVPLSDVREAMRDSLPGLIAWLRGDERNVILTLARMWVTAVTGDFLPKDKAAEWAVQRLPEKHAALLTMAGRAYRGEVIDRWEGLEAEAAALAERMRREIESSLVE